MAHFRDTSYKEPQSSAKIEASLSDEYPHSPYNEYWVAEKGVLGELVTSSRFCFASGETPPEKISFLLTIGQLFRSVITFLSRTLAYVYFIFFLVKAECDTRG